MTFVVPWLDFSYPGILYILESEIVMDVLLLYPSFNTVKFVSPVQINVTLLSCHLLMIRQLARSVTTFANRLKMKSACSRRFMIHARQEPTLNTSV